jgi:HAD superfamily hydrolase (TIGR01509 family)
METLKKIPTFNYIKKNYPNVDTVLFDMDGTIIDSEHIHMDAIFKIMGPVMSHQKLFEMGIGKTDDIVLRELQALGYMEGLDYDRFTSLKLGFMMEIIENSNLSLVPSINTLIKDINKANFKLALVTSSERDFTEFIFNKLGLHKYFDLIITRNDVTKPKPDPYPYLMAMTQIQSSPAKSLIFEDSPTGLRSALASKANVIKVEWFNE